MRMLLFLNALLIAGCSTTAAEMRTHRPSATWESGKSVAELEECIALELSWMGNPSTVHGPSRTALSWSAVGNTHFMVTIEAGSPHSIVQVRSQFGAGARQRRSIERCL